MKRNAFTMIELIFVIVVMGIIGKFGVEFLINAYQGFINTTVYNRMQSQSETALTQIGARLQYRIKDSVIGRPSVQFPGNNYTALQFANSANILVLEWVGYDIDGWRGDWNGGSRNVPSWSGFIDVEAPTANDGNLNSPQTREANLTSIISALSYGTADANDSAIFFIGGPTQIDQYGWGSGTLADQNDTPHPVRVRNDWLEPRVGSFSGIDVYEYYQLAWSAYAIEHDTTNKRLMLHYNYRPWINDYADRQTSILMENVEQFSFRQMGESIWIQVCTKDQNFKDTDDGNCSICKEKTVF
ncbi:MAG: prepilin-type N-terminal cleavage/methylation domain-containing protein [Campylobacterales bacterium]|nr:prepilin-type N-terminal cleavage/methylation domain-containing protein [Campylobacterales bacterium]